MSEVNFDKVESSRAHAARAIEFIKSFIQGNEAAKEWALYHIEKVREFWDAAFRDEPEDKKEAADE